jgi:hypothetical protein
MPGRACTALVQTRAFLDETTAHLGALQARFR